MKKHDLKEHVRRVMEMVPDHGISVAKGFYMYMVQQELDKEFINEISKLLSEPEEKELNELYEWDIMKDKQ